MAVHRHERDANARRKPRAVLVAGPVALLSTALAVTLGVAAADPATREAVVADTSPAPSVIFTGAARSLDELDERRVVSRDQSRVGAVVLQPLYDVDVSRPATQKAIRGAHIRLWATSPLNLWSTPGHDAERRGLLEEGKRVLVTGRSSDGRDEVVLGRVVRWVSQGYLAEQKPVKEKPVEKQAVVETEAEAEPEETVVERSVPAASATCSNGSSVASGVSPNVVEVHQAVCANFPEITSYGTFRSDGEHSQGIAVDIMVSGSRGWEVAEFLRSRYSSLGISYMIYSQSIWSVERGGEGWRGMEDRGSTTANHYDHVHVTTY